ncbi:hypothetical protein [Acinetobacter sp. c3-l95]|uniref:hypothetical protein n=1 Tax=Acinetobacter sp. c3-l95 TaxID=3342804 RepID=UPI0035B91AF9
MKILITSPRAPVALEWANFALAGGHQVLFCDGLQFPISIFAKIPNKHKKISYHKIPSPRLDFAGYQRQMMVLIDAVDILVPTCEDIFYLAKLPLSPYQQQKCFMPNKALLLGLHDKFGFFDLMPKDSAIQFPETRYINDKEKIILDNTEQKSILKPVYSRFGRSVVRGVSIEKIQSLDISAKKAWVQQQFITGDGLCNYAICEHGKILAHAIYRPRYLLNDAASTYFEPVQDARLDDFVAKFAQLHQFHGQVAFDFIDDGQQLWLLECNPRATSGLHLLRHQLAFDGQGQLQSKKQQQENPNVENPSLEKKHDSKPMRVGASLPALFGIQAIKNGTWQQLWQDYQRAEDVIADLPIYAQWLSLGEMFYRRVRYKHPLTNASTFDIEYDGDDN